MKKVIFFATIILGMIVAPATVNGQNGIANPITGKFWNRGTDGPVSKYIHQNSFPQSGDYRLADGRVIEVKILSASTLILFAEGNYANHNRNWVSAPYGKLWRFKGTTQWFLAECGNAVADIFEPITEYVTVKEIEYRDRVIDNTIASNNACDTANLMFAQLYERYQGGSIMNFDYNRANAELEYLKQQYPGCLDGAYLLKAGKGGKFIADNAVLAALGTAILLSKKGKKGNVVNNTYNTVINNDRIGGRPNNPGENTGETWGGNTNKGTSNGGYYGGQGNKSTTTTTSNNRSSNVVNNFSSRNNNVVNKTSSRSNNNVSGTTINNNRQVGSNVLSQNNKTFNRTANSTSTFKSRSGGGIKKTNTSYSSSRSNGTNRSAGVSSSSKKRG